jgi:hypothetical protein
MLKYVFAKSYDASLVVFVKVDDGSGDDTESTVNHKARRS